MHASQTITDGGPGMDACQPPSGAQILETEAMLERLGAEHVLARRHLSEARDPFIQCMPLNILSDIFCMDVDNHSSSPSGAGRALVAASVSKAWRNAIFSLPEVWTTIWMHRGRPFWHFPLQLAEEWLCRSRNRPIHVSVKWTTALDHPSTLSLQGIAELMQLIQKQSHRLRSLTLDVPTSVLSMLTAEEMPLLRVFSITVGKVVGASNVIDYTLLTQVVLKESLSILESLELFQVCTNLIRCTLCVEHYRPRPFPEEMPKAPHILAKLQYLELDLFMEDTGDIIDWITTPQLRHLHLILQQTIFHAHQYANMMERSRCPVRSFVYENPWMEAGVDEDLSVLLLKMPTLHCLTLRVDVHGAPSLSLQDSLFSRLIRPDTARDSDTDSSELPLFLPALRQISYWGPFPLTWSEFATLSEAHAQGRTNYSLASVSIVLQGKDAERTTPCDAETTSRLNALPQSTRTAFSAYPIKPVRELPTVTANTES